VWIFVLALISLAVLSGSACAHPPADVVVTYDDTTGDLVIAITHQTDDPATHYVKQVTVRQSDMVLIDYSYTSQPDPSSFTYRYNLPQLRGSSGEIRVDAQCSLFGSRSGTLRLTASSEAAAPSAEIPSAPAPTQSPLEGCVTLGALGIAAARIRR
jgi:hypothetical protein